MSVATHTTASLVEQRDRPVLHLAGRVGVGRDVGDLLQLERALEADGQADVAAEVEEELAVLPVLRDLPHRLVDVARAARVIRCGSSRSSPTERAHARRLGARRAPAASFSPSRYIAATCDTNVFVAATPISSPARVNRTASASRVAWLPMTFVMASTVAPRSRASRIAASVSAVSPDCEIPITRSSGPTHGVAVAVLRRDVHLDRHARPLLDRVPADEAGVVRGPAGDDHDPADAREQLVRDPDVAELDAASPQRGRRSSRPPRPAARGSPSA